MEPLGPRKAFQEDLVLGLNDFEYLAQEGALQNYGIRHSPELSLIDHLGFDSGEVSFSPCNPSKILLKPTLVI